MPMKRLDLAKSLLIAVTAISLVVSFIALYDNDEPNFDLLCSNNDFLSSQYILSFLPLSNGKLYEQSNVAVYKKPLISYLSAKEKSPPLVFSGNSLMGEALSV